jgi:hypothetical protein
MQEFSLGKGRKKAVTEFTTRQGLWMLALLTGAAIATAMLFLLGVLRVD